MLGGILSQIQVLLSRLTATRAGYLDKLNITGNVADGNDYTAARAAKLDNLDDLISSRAPASTAVSNVDYTAARAAKLDNILPPVSISNNPFTSYINNQYVDTFSVGQSDNTYNNNGEANGFKKVTKTDGSGSYVDVVNMSGYSGYIWFIGQRNNDNSLHYGQLKLTVDGVDIIETSYDNIAAKYIDIIIGRLSSFYNGSAMLYHPVISIIPLKVSSNFRLQHKANSAQVETKIIYTLD
jgi:hypothetical protein